MWSHLLLSFPSLSRSATTSYHAMLSPSSLCSQFSHCAVDAQMSSMDFIYKNAFGKTINQTEPIISTYQENLVEAQKKYVLPIANRVQPIHWRHIRLLREPVTSDLTIVCGDRTWQCQRATLAQRCEFFRVASFGGFSVRQAATSSLSPADLCRKQRPERSPSTTTTPMA